MKKNEKKTQKREDLLEFVLNQGSKLTGDEKTPSYLSERQMEDLQHFIEDEWGEGSIIHELSSEYVHTDVMACECENGSKAFASFGMSAREMEVPKEARKAFNSRIELVLRASPELKVEPEEGETAQDVFLAANQLIATSKYPFREHTWLGALHTVNASKKFREKYGYGFFLFLPFGETKVKGLGEVTYLLMLPVYEEERNWMAEREGGSWRFLEAYLDALDDENCDFGYFDVPREKILPEG